MGEDRNSPTVSSMKTPLIICGLVLFAVFLSFGFLLSQSLRLDESQSMWQAAHTPAGILKVVAEDVHPPLYHFLLHFWQELFGNGVATARLLSLLFYLLAIPLLYVLGRAVFDEKTALFATLVFVCSPFMNWYGNEIRMYSLLPLFTIVNQIFFIAIFKRKWANHGGEPVGKPSSVATRLDFRAKDANLGDGVAMATPRRDSRLAAENMAVLAGNGVSRQALVWIGYFLSALLGIYTHYFFFFVLVTQLIFFFLYRSRFPEHALRNFAIIAFVLFLAFLPWLNLVRSVGLAGNAQPNLFPPTSIDVFNTFSNFIFGFQTDPINTIILSFWPLIALLGFLALRRNNGVSPEVVYLLVAIFVPVVMAVFVSYYVRPAYLTRYFVEVFPSLCLVIAWFLYLYPRRLATVLQASLIALMICMTGLEIGNPATPVKENYEGAVAYVEAQATAKDVVVVSAPFTIYPIEYYYHGSASLTTLPDWNRLVTGPIPQFSENLLDQSAKTMQGEYEYAWVILSYNQGYENQIKSYFDSHYARVEEKNFSPNLNVYAYRLRNENTGDFDSIVADLTGTKNTPLIPNTGVDTNTTSSATSSTNLTTLSSDGKTSVQGRGSTP